MKKIIQFVVLILCRVYVLCLTIMFLPIVSYWLESYIDSIACRFERITRSYWEEWMSQEKNNTQCVIDFSEVMDFEWDTMVYYSGDVDGYYELPPSEQIDLGFRLTPRHDRNECVRYMLRDSCVKEFYLPEYRIEPPYGVLFLIDKPYMKLPRENTAFHLIKDGDYFKVKHINKFSNSETKSIEELSPFSGKWDATVEKDRSFLFLKIGASGDSLLAAIDGLLRDSVTRGLDVYRDSDGFMIPSLVMRQSKDSTVANGFLLTKNFRIEGIPESSNNVPISLKLLNDTTLLWQTEEHLDMLPSTIRFKRSKRVHTTFSPNFQVEN